MKPWHAPIVALCALFLIMTVGSAIAAATGTSVSPAFELLFTLGFAWAVAWWVSLDCRRRRIPVSIDHGWYVMQLWPIALPLHVFRTRGAVGCLALAGLTVAWVAGWWALWWLSVWLS
jgi:hypothetical protein